MRASARCGEPRALMRELEKTTVAKKAAACIGRISARSAGSGIGGADAWFSTTEKNEFWACATQA